MAMLVAVEKTVPPAPQPAGVFGRLQAPAGLQQLRVSQGSNVRAGLFGTSLHEQEEEEKVPSARIVFQERERPVSSRGGGDREG
ncbi:hypothetical protein EON64_10215, partial [archaeon]